MQRTLKKFVLLLLLVCSVICCAVFAACGNDDPEEQKVTYSVTVTTEDDSITLTSLKAQWLKGTEKASEEIALDAEGKASVSLAKGNYSVTLINVPETHTFTAANVTAENSNATIVIAKKTLPEPTTEYTVTFDLGYEGAPASTTAKTVDGKVAKPADPERGGYKFLGWFNGEELWNFDATVTEDMTLTAKWEENGDVPAPNTATYNVTVTSGDDSLDFTTVTAQWLNSDGVPAKEAKLGADGKASVEIEDGEYTLTLSGVASDHYSFANRIVGGKDGDGKDRSKDATIELTCILILDNPTNIVIPTSGQATYELKISGFGNYVITIEGASGVTIQYTYGDKITAGAPFEADPGLSIYFKGAAGTSFTATMSEYNGGGDEANEYDITLDGTPIDVQFKNDTRPENLGKGFLWETTLLFDEFVMDAGSYLFKLSDVNGAASGTTIYINANGNTIGTLSSILNGCEVTIKLPAFTGSLVLEGLCSKDFTAKVSISKITEPEVNTNPIEKDVTYENAKIGSFHAYQGGPFEIKLGTSVTLGVYTLTVLNPANYAQYYVAVSQTLDDMKDAMADDGNGYKAEITVKEGVTHIYLYSYSNADDFVNLLLEWKSELPEEKPEGKLGVGMKNAYEAHITGNSNPVEQPDHSVTAPVSKTIALDNVTAGEYYLTLVGSENALSSEWIITIGKNSYKMTTVFTGSGKTVEISDQVTIPESCESITVYCEYLTFDVEFTVYLTTEPYGQGGSSIPDVPENVIVLNVEKEITISACTTKDYKFTAVADGEVTITLYDVDGGDFTVKVGGGDPIIDCDFGVYSGKFNVVAGQEYTITFYSGMNRTFKVIISGGEAEGDNVFVLDTAKTISIGYYQGEDYIFNAPEAGIYRITLSGIKAGDVIINEVIDETELTGTFTARTAGEEVVLSFWGWKDSTFTAIITFEQSLEGSDGKLVVGGTASISVPGVYGIATKVTLVGLVEGNAYSITITKTNTNLNRNWIYFNYAGKQYQLEAMQMTITFIATSADTLSVTSNIQDAADAVYITVALNNALAVGGTPFEVFASSTQAALVYMAGIAKGKSYTVQIPMSPALGRVGAATLRYNSQSIKFEPDEEWNYICATFTAVMDDYNHLISYVEISSSAFETDGAYIPVQLVLAAGSGEGEGGTTTIEKEFTLSVVVDGNGSVPAGAIEELTGLAAGTYTLELLNDGGMLTSWEKLVLGIGTAGQEFTATNKT